MGTVAEKLERVAASKEALRMALGLGTEVPFRDYAGAVSGGGAGHCIAFSDTPPERTDCLWIRGPEPARVRLSLHAPVLDGSAPALATPMAQSPGVVLDGRLWSCGGWGPYPAARDDWARNDEIRYFDPAQGHVVTALHLPEALSRVTMAAVDGKLYLFGGQGYARQLTDRILVLDPAAMTLTEHETRLPAPSYRYCAAVGGTVYLFGGFDGSLELDEILAFDTGTGALRVLEARLPEIAWGLGVAACEGKIYIFGGQRGSRPETGMDRILRFDPADESLTEMAAKLPRVHMNPVPVTVGRDIWLLGGYRYTETGSELFEFMDSVDIYHTEEDRLGPGGLRLPENRAYMTAGLLGSRIYAFGGMVTKDLYTDAGWCLETRPGLEPDTLRLWLGQGPQCVLLEGRVAMTAGVEGLLLTDPGGTITRPMACVWQNGAWTEI